MAYYADQIQRRTALITGHLLHERSHSSSLEASPCLQFTPPEVSEGSFSFDNLELRRLLDGHHVEERDWLLNLMAGCNYFCPREIGGKVFVGADYNQSMKQQREVTMKRISFLLSNGVFEGWLTRKGVEAELKKLAFLECLGIFDHSLSIKLGVHFFLWGGAIQFFGTKRHHDKWLRDTECYAVKGCFAMSELGHGSNVW